MIAMFIKDSEAIKIGSEFIKITIISAPVLGIQFVLNNAFQAMGKAVPSLILSISRQGVIFIPTLFLANAILGLNGIVYAQPIADILTTIISAILFGITYKKELKQLDIKEEIA